MPELASMERIFDMSSRVGRVSDGGSGFEKLDDCVGLVKMLSLYALASTIFDRFRGCFSK